jgi:hypothetical protein
VAGVTPSRMAPANSSVDKEDRGGILGGETCVFRMRPMR